MDVAVVIFVVVEGDEVRPEGRANRAAKLRAERSVNAGALHGESDAVGVVQRLRVADLRLSHGDHSWRTLKLKRVGKGVGIGECAPGLAREDILVLSIELPEAEGCAFVIAQEVKFQISLYRVGTAIDR